MNYAVYIISHKRAETISTLNALRKSGYTGRAYIVVDDKDPQLDEYKKRYKDDLLVFVKSAYSHVDLYDLNQSLDSAVIPKHAVFDFARNKGMEGVVILDDDMDNFRYRFYDHDHRLKNVAVESGHALDMVFDACFDFISETDIPCCIGFLPAGRFFPDTMTKFIRQCVNMFIVRLDFNCRWTGRFADDENTFTKQNTVGALMFSLQEFNFTSKTYDVSKNEGGMDILNSSQSHYSRHFQLLLGNPWNAPITVYDKDGVLRFGTPTPEYTRILSERWKR